MPKNTYDVVGPGPEGDGSGYKIGDNLILTAGHVIYEYNGSKSSPQIATNQGVIFDFTGYNLRYLNEVNFRIASSYKNSQMTPEVIEGDGSVYPYDTVLISGSGIISGNSSVTSSDEGLVLFLDPNDMSSSSSALATSTSVVRRADIHSSDQTGSITVVSSNGTFLFSNHSDKGESGGAYILSAFGRGYVLGTHSGNQSISSSSPAVGVYFTPTMFYNLNSALKSGQLGDVTTSEPHNMIAGTMSGDHIQGTFRADRILGRDGVDSIHDGDLPNATVWADDLLIGGNDDDTFFVGAGDDRIWGGDEYDDKGIFDGFDTVDYSSGNNPIEITLSGALLSGNTVTVADGYGNTDELHSIERIIGTKGDDTLIFGGTFGIPQGKSIIIDAYGGEKDKLNFGSSLEVAGLHLTIMNGFNGDGVITARGRNNAGIIFLKNFHTDVIGSDYDDSLTDLSSFSHEIDAGGGDDRITVGGSHALLRGGAGNDVINLASKSATIQFGEGHGHDIIEFDSGDGDYQLELLGLNPEDIELIAGGRDIYDTTVNPYDLRNKDIYYQFLAVRINSTGETITFLENGRNIGPDGNGSAITYNGPGSSKTEGKLDSIRFANGSVLTQKKILIQGHTDRSGSLVANRVLSQRRADAARDYLISKGIAPHRVEAMGKGYSQPLAGVSVYSAEQRRIEIVRIP